MHKPTVKKEYVVDDTPQVKTFGNAGFRLSQVMNDNHIARVDTIKFHQEIERRPMTPKKTQDAENLEMRKRLEMEKELLQRTIREKSVALKTQQEQAEKKLEI